MKRQSRSKKGVRVRVNGSRPTRRIRAQIATIKAAIHDLLAEEAPCTVRQVFYRLVSAGVIGKTEGEYKSTVVRLLGEMRRNHEIEFNWIADNTRWMRKPRSHSSLEAMLKYSAEAYRRSVWDNQNCYVEVWLEKDALAGVLLDVTATWDVPLMVTRGYPSLSFLYTAAEVIAEQEKPVYLYYFGDHDPSGIDIPRKVEADLRKFVAELRYAHIDFGGDVGAIADLLPEGFLNIHFERLAVMPEQIQDLNLPTRPTKRTDSRAKGFEGESVEVDAIPPKTLRQIASDCITQHVDKKAYDVLIDAEAGEREALMAVARGYETRRSLPAVGC